MTRNTPALHYGWIIVFAGMLAIFAALGLGRFALGMLLPSMGSGLPLSYDQMGYVSTGNFVGYLLAVLISGHGVRRLGSRRIIIAGLLLSGCSMLLVGTVDSFPAVLFLYFLTGIGSGATNIPIMGLVSHWFYGNKRGKAAGLMVIGSGFAIMFSGLLIPSINLYFGDQGWRISWWILGLITLVITLICALLLKDEPSELGLSPVGKAPPPRGQGPEAGDRLHLDSGPLLHLGLIYFLFGFTYVIFATFIVTTLVAEHGMSESSAGRVWFWVGAFSLFSGPAFGALSDRFGRANGLMLVFALQGTAYLLIALPLSLEFVYLSILLFGICAWSIPSIMAAAVGDYLGPSRAAAAFGTITLFFAVGQITGPALAGLMAERSGSFTSAYLLATALAALAMLLTRALKSVRGAHPAGPR